MGHWHAMWRALLSRVRDHDSRGREYVERNRIVIPSGSTDYIRERWAG